MNAHLAAELEAYDQWHAAFDDVHRHEADVYELKAAEAELGELWHEVRESRGANSPK